MKQILNYDNCKINLTESQVQVLIKMQDGQWLEHAPFPPDLKGIISAMDLAINVMSGKFWPHRVVDIKTEQAKVYIPYSKDKKEYLEGGIEIKRGRK